MLRAAEHDLPLCCQRERVLQAAVSERGCCPRYNLYGTGGSLFALQGVCVSAYGTDEFPAFFTQKSGCAAPARVDTPEAAAQMIASTLQLELGSGVVIGKLRFCPCHTAFAQLAQALKTSEQCVCHNERLSHVAHRGSNT